MTSNKIITIDCNYIYPESASSYLIIEDKRAAFIENNTVYAVPVLISALRENGLEPDDVQFIIITHVHLDHAGGTSSLVRECTKATVLAHRRAARHIADPARLIQGATAVYGDKQFKKLYGTIDALDIERIRVMEDGEILNFGSRRLQFIYTLGHSRHHMCIYDSVNKEIFTGDSFGLAYPYLQSGNRPFLFPSTSPPDFVPEEARKSIGKIIETGAERAYFTHFGVRNDLERCAEIMVENINRAEKIMNDAVKSGPDRDSVEKFCVERITDFFKQELETRGMSFSPEFQKRLKLDISLNSKGIAHAALKLTGGH